MGGKNWSGTYSWQVNNDLTMKLMYGENKRNRVQSSLMDENCNRVFDNRTASQGVPPSLQGDRGCTSSSQLESALDTRKAARADFEWTLGNHLLRFGLDREENTSDYSRAYPGPGGLRYDIYARTPGSPLNGGVVPASGLVARTRRYEVEGAFETINSAYYLEDNWQVTPNLLLNMGLRLEAFDNKGGDGSSYIKIDDMLAPRLGFSWDVRGDGTTKVFGNLGRYFCRWPTSSTSSRPVASSTSGPGMSSSATAARPTTSPTWAHRSGRWTTRRATAACRTCVPK